MQRVTFPQPLFEIYRYFRIHDPYDYWHILTVFALSLLLAQDLIDDRKELAREVAASPSHDFGKLCVPLEVLTKRTPLTMNQSRNCSAITRPPAMSSSATTLATRSIRRPLPPATTMSDATEAATREGSPCRTGSLKSSPAGTCSMPSFPSVPTGPAPTIVRTALEEMTLQAEQGAFGLDVVHALINHCREPIPGQGEGKFSHEKRGTSPGGNLYRGVKLCRFDSPCGQGERQGSGGSGKFGGWDPETPDGES